jgi:catechol 2,3-dioxygenase-like lactoylglutathione lyase family enzyme
VRVTGIDHVVLRVRDLAGTLYFYSEVLGCLVVRRRDDIGLIQLRAGDSLIDLVPVEGRLGRLGGAAPGPEGRNLDHLCLQVENFDLDKARAELTGAGVTVRESGVRYGAGGEAMSLYIADPDGNVVELRAAP